MTHKGHRSVDVKKRNKADAEYTFEHGEVINQAFDGVSIHSVPTKIQTSFPTDFRERKESAQGFHYEDNGDLKTMTEFDGRDRRNNIVVTSYIVVTTILTYLTKRK